MHDPIESLTEYVKHASVSTDPNAGKEMEGAREFVCKRLSELGFDVEVIKTPLHPIVLATRGKNPEWPHILMYAHYDVQPADPLELWHTKPFEPEVREGRIYGRGAADNKGPFIVQVSALEKVLEKNPDLPLRITFLVEGEEEMGSPSFPEFLKVYKDRLKEADCVLISDTGSPSADQIAVTTSLRGLVDLEIEVSGPKMDLHSGLHGGPILNPLQGLMELCSSLHNENGTVNVPGFYDEVMMPEYWEREELKKYPISEEQYKAFLGVPEFHPPKGFKPLEATRFAPTLEFNGIGGGYQGEGSKTVIPSKAFAKITCRLVANQDPEKIRDQLVRTLEERCPKGVRLKITLRGGGEPYLVVPPHRPNTPEDQNPILAKVFEALDSSVEGIFGKKPIYIREGGSIPIIGQIKTLTGLDSVLLGLFTPECNLHAPNESFDLGVMEKGIQVYEKVLLKIAGLSS